MSRKLTKEIAFVPSTFLLIVVNIAYMHICIGPAVERGIDLWSPFCFVCFDASVLFLVCYLLSLGRMKIAATIGVVSSLLWSILNVLYGRYFGIYFNYHTLTEARNLADGFMWDSVASGLRWSDTIYLIVMALFGVLLYKIRLEEMSWHGKLRILEVLSITPVLIIMVYGGGNALRSAASELRHIENRVRGRSLTPEFRENDILHNGVFCAQLFDDYILSGERIELAADDIGKIKKHVKSTHESVNLMTPKNKNLIFILVESYLSVSSDMKINGEEVTPFLNKLRHEEGVYFNDSVTSNIELGVSGDGQFIYMTGLLPLRGRVTTSRVAKNLLPSLPNLLNKAYGLYTMMTIPTLPTLWMQSDMCKVYGIEQLYSTNDMDFSVNDSTIMDFSLDNELALTNKTFFHTILTISMHGPYKHRNSGNFVFPSYFSPEFCSYLMQCRYTDRQIGRFLQKLSDNGLYENSVIVIASDHEAHTENLNIDENYSGNKRLPLYIINSGMDLDKCWYGKMNQMDLFPTLLDIFGINSEWRGLGCSIIDSASYKNRLCEETHQVSEKIIDSDYFRKYTVNDED